MHSIQSQHLLLLLSYFRACLSIAALQILLHHACLVTYSLSNQANVWLDRGVSRGAMLSTHGYIPLPNDAAYSNSFIAIYQDVTQSAEHTIMSAELMPARVCPSTCCSQCMWVPNLDGKQLLQVGAVTYAVASCRHSATGLWAVCISPHAPMANSQQRMKPAIQLSHSHQQLSSPAPLLVLAVPRCRLDGWCTPGTCHWTFTDLCHY